MRCTVCCALVTLTLCSAPSEQGWAGGLLFREPGSTCPAQLPADYADALLARIAQLDQTVFPLGSMSARLHEERLALLLFAHEQGKLLWRQGEPAVSLYSAVLSNHVRDKLDGFKLAFIRALQVGAEQEARATLMLAMAFTVEFLDVLEVLGVFFSFNIYAASMETSLFPSMECLQTLVRTGLSKAWECPVLTSLDIHLDAVLARRRSILGTVSRLSAFAVALERALGECPALSPYSRQPEAEDRRQPRT
ncbi:MAG: hypothetical protein OXC07_03815 [Kistimonas sp.]|nr:hypothetical protein [Kistimonas sp.]